MGEADGSGGRKAAEGDCLFDMRGLRGLRTEWYGQAEATRRTWAGEPRSVALMYEHVPASMAAVQKKVVEDLVLLETDIGAWVPAAAETVIAETPDIPPRLLPVIRELARRGMVFPQGVPQGVSQETAHAQGIPQGGIQGVTQGSQGVVESALVHVNLKPRDEIFLMQLMRKVYRGFVVAAAKELHARGISRISAEQLASGSLLLAQYINTEMARLGRPRDGSHVDSVGSVGEMRHRHPLSRTAPLAELPSALRGTRHRAHGAPATTRAEETPIVPATAPATAAVTAPATAPATAAVTGPATAPATTPVDVAITVMNLRSKRRDTSRDGGRRPPVRGVSKRGGEKQDSRLLGPLVTSRTASVFPSPLTARPAVCPAGGGSTAKIVPSVPAAASIPGVSVRRILMNNGDPIIPARFVSTGGVVDAQGKMVVPRWMPLSLLGARPDAQNQLAGRPYGATDGFVVGPIDASWLPMALPALPAQLPQNDNNNNNGAASTRRPATKTSAASAVSQSAEMMDDYDNDDDDDVFDPNDYLEMPAQPAQAAQAAQAAQDAPPCRRFAEVEADAGPPLPTSWMADVASDITRLDDFQFIRTPEKGLIVFFVKNDDPASRAHGVMYNLLSEDSIIFFVVGPLYGRSLPLPADVKTRIHVADYGGDGSGNGDKGLWGVRGRDLTTVTSVLKSHGIPFKGASPLFYKRLDVSFGTECRGPPTTYPNHDGRVQSSAAARMDLATRAEMIFASVRDDLVASGGPAQWESFVASKEEVCALVHVLPPKINVAVGRLLAEKLPSTVSKAETVAALRFERSTTIDISDAQREELLWVMFSYHTLGNKNTSFYLYLRDLLLYFGWYVNDTPYQQNYFGHQTVPRGMMRRMLEEMEVDAMMA